MTTPASRGAGEGGTVDAAAISTLEFWTIREVANLLRVDGSTVRRWCETGRMRAQKFGNAWRVHSSVVDEARRNGIQAVVNEKAAHDPAWDVPDRFDVEEPPKKTHRQKV